MILHTYPDNEEIPTVWRDGLPLTAPARTLADVAHSIQPEQLSMAVRFHVTAQLSGRIFEQFRVDIGFADSIVYKPDTIRSSGLLSFAYINPLELPTIPLPRHLAEKVHAYSRTYGATRTPSTRPKDLIDILLIESTADIEARPLRDALQDTFRERKRQPLPSSLPPPPAMWADPYRRLANSVNIESDLLAAYTRAAAFLDPVLAENAHGRWDPHHRTWDRDFDT